MLLFCEYAKLGAHYKPLLTTLLYASISGATIPTYVVSNSRYTMPPKFCVLKYHIDITSVAGPSRTRQLIKD